MKAILLQLALPAGLSINNVTGELAAAPCRMVTIATIIAENDEGKVTKTFAVSVFDPSIFFQVYGVQLFQLLRNKYSP